MVGQGVLLECFDHPEVESVLLINRSHLGISHPKLKELIHGDFFDLGAIRTELSGYNTCFFCLGVSSAGMSEAAYRRTTYDLTIHFAQTFLELNPGSAFCYVSGTGTDSSEKGRLMWARVKGKTENDLLAMPFRDAYMFRPGFIQPLKGIRSKTPLYNRFYAVTKPFYPFLKRFTGFITDTQRVGKAMIRVVLDGYGKKHLENGDINAITSGR